MKHLLFVCTLFIGLSLTAQTVEWGARKSPAQVAKPANYEAAMKQTQTGYATYYADYLAGKPTAHGEIYQPTELTASHSVLPIGTIIKVTRLDNGQSVDARVNDSGGLCKGCIVVLSRAAAAQIGLTTTGKSRVTVTRTGFSNWNPRPQRATSQATTRSAQVYERRPANQPAVYGQVNRQPSAYGQPVPRTPSAYGKVPTPTRYNNSRTAATPPSPRTVQPNRIGSTEPDFGDAYGQPAPVYNTGVARSPQEDPNAYRRAQSTSAQTAKSGAVITPSAYRQPNVVRPAVVEREVTTSQPQSYNNYRTLGQPTPVAYQPRAVATPMPAEVAPVSEVQVASNVVKQGYAIQLAAYGNVENAMRQVRSLQARGVDNIYLASVPRADGSTLNRVLVGPFGDMATAQSSADGLQRDKQLTGIVVKLR